MDLRALGLVGGTQAHRLEQEEPSEVAVPGEGLETGAERGLDFAEGAMRARDGVSDRVRQPRREVVDEGEEDRFLVREVVVDGALGRFRDADNVVDHGPVIPFASKYLEGRVQDPLARGDLAHRQRPREIS